MDVVSRTTVRKLYFPKAGSHKGQNGILLVIGGSEKYHGAPLLAIKAASRIVDLVYFHSPASLSGGRRSPSMLRNRASSRTM